MTEPGGVGFVMDKGGGRGGISSSSKMPDEQSDWYDETGVMGVKRAGVMGGKPEPAPSTALIGPGLYTLGVYSPSPTPSFMAGVLGCSFKGLGTALKPRTF